MTSEERTHLKTLVSEARKAQRAAQLEKACRGACKGCGIDRDEYAFTCQVCRDRFKARTTANERRLQNENEFLRELLKDQAGKTDAWRTKYQRKYLTEEARLVARRESYKRYDVVRRARIQERNCANPDCGKLFRPLQDIGKYCSITCSNRAAAARRKAA